MFGVFFFILPIILSLIALPVKIALKTALRMAVRNKTPQESALDKASGVYKAGLSTMDNTVGEAASLHPLSNLAYKTARVPLGVVDEADNIRRDVVSDRSVVGTVGSSAFRVTRGLVSWGVAALRFILWVLYTAIVMLVSLGTVGIVILIVICVLLFMALITACIASQNNLDDNNSSVSGGLVGNDYFSIDWSQDFSAKLDEIQATHGELNRNWVELVIIDMNTRQQKVKDFPTNACYMPGFKRAETGPAEIMSVHDDTGLRPSKDNSIVCSSGSGDDDDGPMQILDESAEGWCMENDLYHSSSNNTTDLERRFFFPDIFYGTYMNFMKGEINIEVPERISRAFTDCGVAMDDSKAKLVMAELTPFSYNSGRSADTNDNWIKDSYYEGACLLVLFHEAYGWDAVNDTIIKLSRSMDTATGGSADNMYIESDREPIVGQMPSKSNPSSHATWFDKGNYGVLTKDGSAYDGRLYGYLISLAPDKVASTLKDGDLARIFDQGEAGFSFYPFSVLLQNAKAIDTAVDWLGLKSQMNASADGSTMSSTGQKKKKVIMAGDSRTCTIRDDTGVSWANVQFTSEIGMGYSYFTGTEVPFIDSNVDGDTAVVIWMGVNDLSNNADATEASNNYINYLKTKAPEWTAKGAEVYYLSVGQVEHDLSDTTKASIDKFNQNIQSGLGSVLHYMDINDFIVSNGYGLEPDGLHYTAPMAEKIMKHILSQVQA